MASDRTVGQLTGSVRRRTDFEDDSGGYGDSYISDAVMFDFIDQAWTEAYDVIVTADPDRYVSEHSFTTVAGTSDYDLPSELYRLRGVDISTSSGSDDWYRVHRYELGERDVWQDASSGRSDTPFVYRMVGTRIRLQPEPTDSRSVRLTYLPVATRLSASDQTVDGINGHEELAVNLACRMVCVRAQQSTAEFDAAIARQTDRVSRMAGDRDAGSPRRLIDPRRVAGGRRRRYL